MSHNLTFFQASNGILIQDNISGNSIVMEGFDPKELGLKVMGFFTGRLFKVTLHNYGQDGNKISLIRALRMALNLGLREAKDLAETCEIRNNPDNPYERSGYKDSVIFTGTLQETEELFKALKECNCTAQITRETV